MISIKKIPLVFLFVLTIHSATAQEADKQFKDLNCAEKCWVFLHPFKAKKAYRISKKATATADSLSHLAKLDSMSDGGKLDAFRHAFWMLSLAQKLGKRRALSLGKAHEKHNKKTFYKNNSKSLPDYASTQMDLNNNCLAVELVDETKDIKKEELIAFILKKIKSGYFFMIKHNSNKQWLDAHGNIISKKQLHENWKNGRCLVKTNEAF